MKKVLVTGGAGFLGFHLSRALVDGGSEVVILDNFQRGQHDLDMDRLLETGKVTVATGDLCDPAVLAGLPNDFTHVYHLAAVVGVKNVVDAPYATLSGNVAALAEVITWAHSLPQLERLCFPSTSEVYSETIAVEGGPVPTPEDVKLIIGDRSSPRATYMLSKIVGEALCLQSGLPVSVFRPHNVFGPRMGLSHVVPELLQRARNHADGDEFVVYSPDHTRTFCYVDDAVELMIRFATAPAALNEVLNLGSVLDEISMGDLAQMVADVVGRDLNVVSGGDTPGSPMRRRPDMAKTIEATGYTPSVSLREGVERTWAWYEENAFGENRQEKIAV